MTKQEDTVYFRTLTEEECFSLYGFSKQDMELLYNNGIGLSYEFKEELE